MTGTEQTIGEAALAPPVRLASDATLRSAAGVMAETGLTCVLVGEGAPRVLTDHDLAAAVAAALPGDAPAIDVATREPIWATTSTTVAEAVALMTGNGVRHLVVLSATGAVLGVLSLLEATRRLLDEVAPVHPPRR